MTIVFACLWASFLATVVSLAMHGAACDRRNALRRRTYHVGDVIWELEEFSRYGPSIR